VKENCKSHYGLNDLKYTDIFRGPPPVFEQTFGRGQFSRTNINKLNDSKTSTSPSNRANQQQNSKQKSGSPSSSKPKKGSPHQQQQSKKYSKAQNEGEKKKSKANDSDVKNKSKQEAAASKGANKSASKSQKDAVEETEADLHALKIVQLLEKKVIEMSNEEYELWRHYKPEEDLKELKQIESEYDKLMRKEEKEKVCFKLNAFNSY
jgi:hypothetical protein